MTSHRFTILSRHSVSPAAHNIRGSRESRYRGEEPARGSFERTSPWNSVRRFTCTPPRRRLPGLDREMSQPRFVTLTTPPPRN
jgi:hypothetical protein